MFLLSCIKLLTLYSQSLLFYKYAENNSSVPLLTRMQKIKDDGCAVLKFLWFGHDMFCTKRLLMAIIQQSVQQ